MATSYYPVHFQDGNIFVNNIGSCIKVGSCIIRSRVAFCHLYYYYVHGSRTYPSFVLWFRKGLRNHCRHLWRNAVDWEQCSPAWWSTLPHITCSAPTASIGQPDICVKSWEVSTSHAVRQGVHKRVEYFALLPHPTDKSLYA